VNDDKPVVDYEARLSIAVLQQSLRDLVLRLDGLREEVRSSSRGLILTVFAAAICDIVSRALGK
jgi:hypothetical protein